MKIKEGIVQQMIKEELTRAIKRRSRDGLTETIFQNVDLNDLMVFARAYRAMSDDLTESFEAMLMGDFADVYAPVETLKESMGNVHPEIDQAFADHKKWSKLNG